MASRAAEAEAAARRAREAQRQRVEDSLAEARRRRGEAVARELAELDRAGFAELLDLEGLDTELLGEELVFDAAAADAGGGSGAASDAARPWWMEEEAAAALRASEAVPLSDAELSDAGASDGWKGTACAGATSSSANCEGRSGGGLRLYGIAIMDSLIIYASQ